MTAHPEPTTSPLLRQSAGRAVAALAAYEGGVKIYESGKNLWRRRFAYTVSVSERDPIYGDVHDWLLSILPDERHRALVVTSAGARTYLEPTPEAAIETPVPALKVRFNDSSARPVVIDGHRISVVLRTPEVAQNSDREPAAATIEFTARSYAAQQAIIQHLRRINSERSSVRVAMLRMVNSWGSWRARSDLPPRTLDSVALPGDQKTRIVDDLTGFLAAEDRYNRLAIPWHRGYMFHGPPGTGKTSLVKALANHFNLDLWYVSLADLKAESSLLGLLSEVGPRSLLLLEDIDTMKITQNGVDGEQGAISIGSLLQALDGVATPHGLITIMTTNHFDKLDPRLTRAGRMDVVEELDHLTYRTLCELYEYFYGRRPGWRPPSADGPIVGLSAAQVAEEFKRHLDDPAGAEVAVAGLLETVIRR